MNRFVITEVNGRLFLVRLEEDRITELIPVPREKSELGCIYTARVKHIKKDIRAAFLEYAPGKICYLPLDEIEKYQVPGIEQLREGDMIPVQIEREAVKLKQAVSTINLTLTGEYVVLMAGKRGISISSRIRDPKERERLHAFLSELCAKDAVSSVIVRTNAEGAPEEAVRREYEFLKDELSRILKIWSMRNTGTILYEPEQPMLSEIYNNQLGSLDEIVVDSPEILKALRKKQEQLSSLDPDRKLPSLRLYEDSYPLGKLYRIEKALSDALSKKVWLRSGGFLVIEPTEALVSIDVNTGKSDGKKTIEETFLAVNLEAAKEIAVQLRLRNLSGMILIDFIDMKVPEHRDKVKKLLIEELKKDPVKTNVLEFTRLGLLELTRKKIRKPLHET